jgi:hypothetical protein
MVNLAAFHPLSSPLLPTVFNCCHSGLKPVEELVIQCLAEVTPVEISSAVALMQLILTILRAEAKHKTDSLLSNAEMDELIATAMERGFHNIEPLYQHLMAREILLYLVEFGVFAKSSTIGVILKAVGRLLRADRGFARFASGFLWHIFSEYYKSATLLETYMKMCDWDRSFQTGLLAQYGDLVKKSNYVFVPAIIKLFPEHTFNFENFADQSPELISQNLRGDESPSRINERSASGNIWFRQPPADFPASAADAVCSS